MRWFSAKTGPGLGLRDQELCVSPVAFVHKSSSSTCYGLSKEKTSTPLLINIILLLMCFRSVFGGRFRLKTGKAFVQDVKHLAFEFFTQVKWTILTERLRMG